MRTKYITVVAGWFAIAGLVNVWLCVQTLARPEMFDALTRMKGVVMALGGPIARNEGQSLKI